MQEFGKEFDDIIRAGDLYLSASSKRDRNDYIGAISLCNEMILTINKSFEEYQWALDLRAQCKEAMGDFQNAVQDYDALVALNPDKHNFYNRGNLKRKLKDYVGAKNDYHYALNLSDHISKSNVVCALISLEAELGTPEGLDKVGIEFGHLLDVRATSVEVNIKENSLPHEIKENEQTDDFQSQLKFLENDVINSNLSLSELNKRFQELGNQAAQSKSIDFYLLRARFYDVSAQHEKARVRQEALYKKALQDYHQAIDFDPFVEEAPERVEEIESILKSTSSKAPTKVMFSSNPGNGNQSAAQTLPKISTPAKTKRAESIEEKIQYMRIAKK